VVVEDAEVVRLGEPDLDPSPFTFFSDRASPEAQRGKFSGTEAKS